MDQQQLPPMRTYVAVLSGSIAAPLMNIQFEAKDDPAAYHRLQDWARYIDTGHHWKIDLYRKAHGAHLDTVGSYALQRLYGLKLTDKEAANVDIRNS